MVIASAGQTASHSLQAMQRSSPFSYRRRACRPRKRGDSGVFSSGNCTVILRAKKYLPVMRRPLNSSSSMKLPRKSFSEKAVDRVARVLEDNMALCLPPSRLEGGMRPLGGPRTNVSLGAHIYLKMLYG